MGCSPGPQQKFTKRRPIEPRPTFKAPTSRFHFDGRLRRHSQALCSSFALSSQNLILSIEIEREMLARRLNSLSHTSSRLLDRPLSLHCLSCFSTSSEQAGRKSSFRRKALPIVLISLTGGVALSGLNDLAIFHGCSSKAIERASQNQKVVEILGEPIVRGPWYDASIAVGHRRHSVSCTFPVTGPLGSGTFQLKAIRNGDDTWFSFLRHNDWQILLLEALIHDKDQQLRISIADQMPSPPQNKQLECEDCKVPAPKTP